MSFEHDFDQVGARNAQAIIELATAALEVNDGDVYQAVTSVLHQLNAHHGENFNYTLANLAVHMAVERQMPKEPS